MATSVESMGTGIATRLETISQLRGAWGPTEIKGSFPEFPWGLVFLESVDYALSFQDSNGRPHYGVIFRVVIAFARADDITSLGHLLDYTEPSGSDSVYAAINGDPTLGSSADFAIVRNMRSLGDFEWGGNSWQAAEFEVYAEG